MWLTEESSSNYFLQKKWSNWQWLYEITKSLMQQNLYLFTAHTINQLNIALLIWKVYVTFGFVCNNCLSTHIDSSPGSDSGLFMIMLYLWGRAMPVLRFCTHTTWRSSVWRWLPDECVARGQDERKRRKGWSEEADVLDLIVCAAGSHTVHPPQQRWILIQ